MLRMPSKARFMQLLNAVHVPQVAGSQGLHQVKIHPLQSVRSESAPTDQAAIDRNRLDRLATTIEFAGSLFVLGVMVVQAVNLLPVAELAGRIVLACWTLTAFRLAQAGESRFLLLQAMVQCLAMIMVVFSHATFANDGQLAIDVAFILAGWAALAARVYLLLASETLRARRVNRELERRRLNLGFPAR
jgi:hypothetical protein